MNREETSSSRQDEPIPAPSIGPISDNTGTQSRTRPRRRRRRTMTTQFKLFLGFITAIAPIVVAWLGYQATLPKPTPVPVHTLAPASSLTPPFTEMPATFAEMPSATFDPTFTPFPSSTNTLTVTAVPTETITLVPQPKLIVLLQANKTSGKAPLAVKLDARESYLTDYDGQRYVCRNGTCHYTWKVYTNGQQIGKSATGSGGTFDYRFTKKGIFTVTVWICRGQDEHDCGGSGIQILVN
jgi:hypothetical protein